MKTFRCRLLDTQVFHRLQEIVAAWRRRPQWNWAAKDLAEDELL